MGIEGQWCNVQKPQAEMMAGTYSSGNCCRLARHSLLILPRYVWGYETNELYKCNEFMSKAG